MDYCDVEWFALEIKQDHSVILEIHPRTAFWTLYERDSISSKGLLPISSVQLLSHVQFFVTPWTAAHQSSLSITNCQSLLKLMSIESVMPSNHLIFFVPFSSCLQYFPASGSFQMSQFFSSGGQSIGISASASVLSMNIQD